MSKSRNNYNKNNMDDNGSDDDRDTIISYADNSNNNKSGDVDELTNNLKKLTAQFGGELAF